jgi:hypothetical protein
MFIRAGTLVSNSEQATTLLQKSNRELCMANLNTFYQTLFRQVAMATGVQNNAVLHVRQQQRQEGMLDAGIPFLCHEYKYSSSDSTKSPASGMAKLGKPSLMSLVRRVREVVSA